LTCPWVDMLQYNINLSKQQGLPGTVGSLSRLWGPVRKRILMKQRPEGILLCRSIVMILIVGIALEPDSYSGQQ